MVLEILGSSSSGNCYLLKNNDEVLIIEAGVDIEKVKKALDFDFSKVAGLILTHEHGDHAKYANDFMRLGIDVFATYGTHKAIKHINTPHRKFIKQFDSFSLGNFFIKSFATYHDTLEPVGFLINHSDIGNLLFCTDSKKLPYTFKDLDHIMIEANYDFNLIPKSAIRDRVYQNHMEIGTAIQFLENNNLSNVKNIVLLHLSHSNSNEMVFKQRVERLTNASVFVANEGLRLSLNKDYF